jgi:hypothetical protein
MGNKTKSKSLEIHARKRLMERYGLKYSKTLVDALLNQVHNGKAVFLKKQSLRVTIWDALYGEIMIRFVYDKKRKAIVTFLSQDMDPYCFEENEEH